MTEIGTDLSKTVRRRLLKHRFVSHGLIALVILCSGALAYAYLFHISTAARILMGAYLAYVTLSLVNTWWENARLLRTVNAYMANPEDHPHYVDVVTSLSKAAGISMPRAYLVDDPTPNAFALGLIAGRSGICVTTGLLHQLNNEELRAVVAHELFHLKSRDRLLVSIIKSASALVFFCMTPPRFGSEKRAAMANLLGYWWFYALYVAFALLFVGMASYLGPQDVAFALAVCIGLPTAIALLVAMRFWIVYFAPARFLRERELLADAESAILIGSPEILIAALKKTYRYNHKLRNHEGSLSDILFAPPDSEWVQDEVDRAVLDRYWPNRLPIPHPTLQERVAHLEEMMPSANDSSDVSHRSACK